jgi:hypothetical protein
VLFSKFCRENTSFFNFVSRKRCMVNSTPRRFTPGKETHYLLYRRLGWCGKSRPTPGFDPRTIHLVTIRYSDYAIPAHIYYIMHFLNWICTYLVMKQFTRLLFNLLVKVEPSEMRLCTKSYTVGTMSSEHGWRSKSSTRTSGLLKCALIMIQQ